MDRAEQDTLNPLQALSDDISLPSPLHVTVVGPSPSSVESLCRVCAIKISFQQLIVFVDDTISHQTAVKGAPRGCV